MLSRRLRRFLPARYTPRRFRADASPPTQYQITTSFAADAIAAFRRRFAYID